MKLKNAKNFRFVILFVAILISCKCSAVNENYKNKEMAKRIIIDYLKKKVLNKNTKYPYYSGLDSVRLTLDGQKKFNAFIFVIDVSTSVRDDFSIFRDQIRKFYKSTSKNEGCIPPSWGDFIYIIYSADKRTTKTKVFRFPVKNSIFKAKYSITVFKDTITDSLRFTWEKKPFDVEFIEDKTDLENKRKKVIAALDSFFEQNQQMRGWSLISQSISGAIDNAVSLINIHKNVEHVYIYVFSDFCEQPENCNKCILPSLPNFNINDETKRKIKIYLIYVELQANIIGKENANAENWAKILRDQGIEVKTIDIVRLESMPCISALNYIE